MESNRKKYKKGNEIRQFKQTRASKNASNSK